MGNNIGELISTGGQVAEAILTLVGEAVFAVLGAVVAAAIFVLYESGRAARTTTTAPRSSRWYSHEHHRLRGCAARRANQRRTAVKHQTLEFFGHTQYPEATSVDGIVDVHFHFEFTNKGVWSPTA